MSGNVLTMLMQNGEEAAVAYLQDVISDIKDIMVLTGCRTVLELQRTHLVYTAETMDFIRSRGYAPSDKRKR
jgi:isopentenyl-diphosphate delta-isomerase